MNDLEFWVLFLGDGCLMVHLLVSNLDINSENMSRLNRDRRVFAYIFIFHYEGFVRDEGSYGEMFRILA